MTFEEMAATLARVTYKPGWSFRLWQSRWEGICMGIRFQAVDAYQPATDFVDIDIKTFVPPCPDEHHFLAFLALSAVSHRVA